MAPSGPPADPFGPEYFRDPYLGLRRLRETAPVYHSERLRRWVVTRHIDVLSVLRDVRRFSSIVIPQVAPGERTADLETYLRLSERWLFFQDPPRHTAERAAVARLLAPRMVDPLAPRIRELAERLAAGLRGGEPDLIAEYAHPLAAGVIAELLGGTDEGRELLAGCSRETEAASRAARDRAARSRGFRGIEAATRWLQSVGAASSDRRLPGAYLRGLQEAGARGGLDPDGVCAHALVLLFAGVETTQNLIANTLLALLRHPDQLAAARAAPALLKAAVEEGLRSDVPVLGVLRRAQEDSEMGGRLLPAGDELVVMLGAANRDPDLLPDPERFDLQRSACPHVAFGFGIHFCPGAALSRMTARIALEAFFAQFPRMELTAAPLSWRDHDPIIRGLHRLPVHLGPG